MKPQEYRERLKDALQRVAEERTREAVEREERKATRALGFVECPGDHSPMTGVTTWTLELDATDEPLPASTLALLADPRLRVPFCDVCGASL